MSVDSDIYFYSYKDKCFCVGTAVELSDEKRSISKLHEPHYVLKGYKSVDGSLTIARTVYIGTNNGFLGLDECKKAKMLKNLKAQR